MDAKVLVGKTVESVTSRRFQHFETIVEVLDIRLTDGTFVRIAAREAYDWEESRAELWIDDENGSFFDEEWKEIEATHGRVG